jgi:hypothetical protein
MSLARLQIPMRALFAVTNRWTQERLDCRRLGQSWQERLNANAGYHDWLVLAA